MKKLMKKKVNIFGKGIPVFVIALLGLAIVSAALLPYFGKITGLVTVTSQGLLVDGLSYDDSNIVDAYDNFTSLESPVYVRMHNLTNNADVQADGIIVSGCAVASTGTGTKSKCSNIDYSAVEYFDNAGANLTNYEAPTVCNVTVGSGTYATIQAGIGNATSGQVVCVEAGTYNEAITINKAITLVSLEGPGTTIISPASGNAVTINSDNVTIKGFTITGAKRGISATGASTGITIRDNKIVDYTEQGIRINGGNVDIINNVIQASATPNSGYSEDSIYTEGGAAVTITNNDLGNNQLGRDAYRNNDWSVSAGISVHNDTVTATYNNIYNNDFGIHMKGVANITANHNNFAENNTIDLFFESLGSSPTSFDANGNWFGTDGIDIAAGDTNGLIDVDSYIDATWMEKTDFSIAPQGVDKFATMASFPKMLYPDTSFTLTTTVDTVD